MRDMETEIGRIREALDAYGTPRRNLGTSAGGA